MSFSFVRGNSATSFGTSVSVALSGTAAGDLLFVMAGSNGPGNTYTILDTGGNIWTSVVYNGGIAGNTGSAQAWFAVSKGGSTTVTVTSSGSNSLGIAIGEWSGATTWTLDQKALNVSGYGSYTSVTSSSVTTTKANELLIGMMLLDDTSITWTAGAGYTSRVAFAGQEAILLEDQSVSSTSSYSASATFNTTAGGIHGGIATFYDAGGAPAKPVVCIMQ